MNQESSKTLPKATYWQGAVVNCDVCQKPFDSTMFDASIPKFGQWACLCSTCFSDYGCSLGTGRGQKYELQADGRWLKTDG